jgi:uncharacterized delta-60 repeat protein/prepilin-type N-terminal cleavage/methylation domain-containing protein
MRDRRGFTLLELLVVVLVIGVLVAIAIPRFSGARSRAQDAVARADLRSVYATAISSRTGIGAGVPWPDAAALAANEGVRTTAGAASVGTVSVAATGDTFFAAALSASGICAKVSIDPNGVPTWTQDTSSPCTAVPPPPPLTLSYSDQSFTAGQAETLAATVTGGTGTGRTFSLTAGSVPAGVTFNTTTGAFATTGLSGSSNGSLDTTFGNGLAGADTGDVDEIHVLGDGKILISGTFTTVNGTPRGGVARLNADGTLDTTFADPAATGGGVFAMAVQTDGKVIIGGAFTSVGGTTRNRIARLNADGSLDTTFGNGLTGANGTVMDVVLLTDGKVVIGGNFTSINGLTRNRIFRLNDNGTNDTTFASGQSGAAGFVRALALQSDGKILVAGDFTTLHGVARGGSGRLNSDGLLDSSYTNTVSGATAQVHAIAVAPDGKIVIAGDFTSVNTTARSRVARLNADGTLDSTFAATPPTVNNYVYAMALQTDGSVLIGGSFTTVGGVGRNHLARLTSSGTHDTTFLSSGTGMGSWIQSIAVQSDSRILVGGSFTSVNGTSRGRIARLAGVTGPAGFPAALTVQVAESGGATASTSVSLTLG